jgi:putative ABC transport system permease protein
VGIVADFHNKSLHQALEPVFILAQKETETGSMFIRIKPGSEKETIPAISELSHRFYPNKILDVNWVSDILAQQYEAEQKQRSLFVFFSNLMLFVSALGVFGLIIHAAEQRVKEIGIRKVLGASVAGIVRMLSSDFVKLVFIAVLIASPIAWWTMNKWLQDFAYRVDIEWWMFVLAGMLAVVIALLTVSFQAVKAAVAKPVDSLRDE